MSEESRKKISEARMGRKMTAEQIFRMSALYKKIGVGKWMRGRKLPLSTRMKMSLARKGRVVSEETKEKIRKAHIGRHPSEQSRQKMRESKLGEKNNNFGKKFSKERKEKIRLSNIGKKRTVESKIKMSISHKGKKQSAEVRKKNSESNSGEKHYNWKGGRSTENQRIRNGIDIRLWREAVFARDNWTCQKTKVKGGRLVAHHIQNFSKYPELRFAIDNGITLSNESHIAFHKKYGNKNNTMEQIEEYIKGYTEIKSPIENFS